MKRRANQFTNVCATHDGVQLECSSLLMPLFRSRSRSRSRSIPMRYGFNGQEKEDELWNGAVSFKYRVEDARLGRFFSVDPKLKEYPWNSTYAFSENRLLDAVELEGLEAWKINAEWDQCYIEAYRSQVKQIITIAQASGIRFTCEDLAIHVLISFASSNGLPVVFQNGTGTYFSVDKTFTNTEEFKNKVQITSGARDLLKSTTKVDPEKLRPGDLILLDTHDSGTINHTQVVIDNNSTQTNIAQGNFVSDWEILTELRISEDPNSKYYLGTFIQRGSYDNQSGNYQRNGEVTESLLCRSTTIPSEWDFNWFNEYTKFHDYFESLKKSSESSDAPVPTVPNNKSDCHGN